MLLVSVVGTHRRVGGEVESTQILIIHPEFNHYLKFTKLHSPLLANQKLEIKIRVKLPMNYTIKYQKYRDEKRGYAVTTATKSAIVISTSVDVTCRQWGYLLLS